MTRNNFSQPDKQCAVYQSLASVAEADGHFDGNEKNGLKKVVMPKIGHTVILPAQEIEYFDSRVPVK